MKKLDHALFWARRGFPVFPLAENSKLPRGGSNGHLDATTNPDIIQAWWVGPWGESFNHNIAIRPPVGCVVVDLDEKEGRRGIAHYEAMGGTVGGLVTRSATGGIHIYTQGADLKNSAGLLAEGVDSRGWDGYIVAPGSTIDGVPYEIISDDPMLPTPAFVVERVKDRSYVHEAPITTFAVEPDHPFDVESAIRWAKQAEPAVQGCWHAYGFRLGAELARLGLSADKTVEVLREHWVPRGTGFASEDQFQRDVLGGYNAAVSKGEHGLNSGQLATYVFKNVVVPEDDEPVDGGSSPKSVDIFPTRTYTEGKALRDLPTPYVVKGLVGPGQLMAVIGPPGSGKSVILPELAHCIATGRPFLGRKVKQRRVVYFAAEDALGLERRLQVVGDKYGDPGDMLLLSYEALNLSWVDGQPNDIAKFKTTLDHLEPGVVILDTLFASYPATDLTDRGERGIAHLVGLSKEIAAHPCRPVVAYAHHEPKGGSGVAYGGQQINAMFDTTLVLEGVMDEERKVYVRKNRLGADGDKAEFRIRSATVGVDEEGDEVTAAILEWSPEKAKDSDPGFWNWLADSQGIARSVWMTLCAMQDELFEAGIIATHGEILAGAPPIQVRRNDLRDRLTALEQMPGCTTTGEADIRLNHALDQLRLRSFVVMDVENVWKDPNKKKPGA